LKVFEIARDNVTVRFRVDQTHVPAPDIEQLSDWIRTEPSLNFVNAGDTVQIGWMVNRFDAEADGLRVVEPDFKTVPIVFVDSMTRTLFDLRSQKDVAESVRLEPVYPSVRQSARRCVGVHGHEFVLHRSPFGGADSGWFLGCVDIDHDHDNPGNLVLDSLYAIALDHAGIIPFLALPSGCTVERYEDELNIYKDDRTLSFERGSFLQRYFEKKR
jgi:hypothetical protein